jgi:hypothetical protein
MIKSRFFLVEIHGVMSLSIESWLTMILHSDVVDDEKSKSSLMILQRSDTFTEAIEFLRRGEEGDFNIQIGKYQSVCELKDHFSRTSPPNNQVKRRSSHTHDKIRVFYLSLRDMSGERKWVLMGQLISLFVGIPDNNIQVILVIEIANNLQLRDEILC